MNGPGVDGRADGGSNQRGGESIRGYNNNFIHLNVLFRAQHVAVSKCVYTCGRPSRAYVVLSYAIGTETTKRIKVTIVKK